MVSYIKDKEIVIPGQIIAEGVSFGENCFKEGNKIFSSIYGLARTDKRTIEVIPLKGEYIPREDDVVIGIVKEIYKSNFFIDINSPYEGTLVPDTKSFKGYDYNVGDIISAIVERVNEVYKCDLSRSFKISGGKILEINPKRVPRIVGKRKSMLEVIKQKTGCRIIVGQNGRIWIDGNKTEKAIEIIKYIEENAYKTGLTDKVSSIF